MSSQPPCLICGEPHEEHFDRMYCNVLPAIQNYYAMQPTYNRLVQLVSTQTHTLGPEQRDRQWLDREGWLYVWSGDTFWNIYRPDGSHADDLIEDVLNDYSDPSETYGPWAQQVRKT
jgi:hypothetical protein